ncbi:MAG TPA: ABC transporter ATP-binding protein [Deltaproteobacteria bacterium]|nr:ABC transporter ATP-binding protein [Deltaproteobacteria bacterium]
MNVLQIQNLHVAVEGKEIIKGVDFELDQGKTAVMFGPNGSGKSTLLGAIAGLPGYEITRGSIWYKGRDLRSLSIDERARLGIGMSFQYPPAIKGVRLSTLLNVLSQDAQTMLTNAEDLNMSEYLDRDINVGFSGGERKRSEILQLMIQEPDLMLLDEPESGVDIENISIIAAALKTILEKDKPIKKRMRSAIIITHTGYILDYINADIAYVIMDGHLLGCGTPGEIFEEIRAHGYKQCCECFAEKYQNIQTGDI